MNETKLIKMGAAAAFALAMLAAVGVLTGSIELHETIQLDEWAVEVAFLALAAGAVLGERSFGDYEQWELFSIAVAVVALAAIWLEQPQVLIDLLNDHHPWTGLGAAAIGYVGYWRAAGGL